MGRLNLVLWTFRKGHDISSLGYFCVTIDQRISLTPKNLCQSVLTDAGGFAGEPLLSTQRTSYASRPAPTVVDTVPLLLHPSNGLVHHRYRGSSTGLHAREFPSVSSTALRLFSTSIRRHEEGQPWSTGGMTKLPHLTRQSAVHQVSVSDKAVTFRRAVAIGHVVFSNPDPYRLILEHSLKKGDVLAVARVAAIMAVKKTSEFIPLAHGGVGVEGCVVDVEVVGSSRSDEDDESRRGYVEISDAEADSALVMADPEQEIREYLLRPIGSYGGIRIAVSVSTTAKTGIEMEALTGVVGASLTIIDMCKAVDRHLKLEGVEVVGKSGGKSGTWGIYSEDNR